MDIKKQLNEFKQIVKAPPIPNPRAEEFADKSNDDLDEAGLETLFEKVADPIIQRDSEKKRDWANIPIKDLKMSKAKALKAAKELYEGKGYPSIFISGDTIAFKLSGQ